jgi:hypothetical protein
MAARKLGLTEAPVIVLSHLTPTQRRALMIADNQITLNAGWNDEMLAAELASLKEEAFDLELLGFDDADLDRLLATPLEPEDAAEVAPEPPADPITRPGDLWICGAHCVLCGDATVLADVEKVLDGELADVCFTDPPYNVNYANGSDTKRSGKKRPILNDALGAEFGELLYDSCVNILTVSEGAVYICMSSSELDTLQQAFRKAGGKWSTFVIWAKTPLPSAARTTSASMSRSSMAGKTVPITTGWAPATRATSGSSTTRQERPAPNHEAGGVSRAGDPKLLQEPRHRA